MLQTLWHGPVPIILQECGWGERGCWNGARLVDSLRTGSAFHVVMMRRLTKVFFAHILVTLGINFSGIFLTLTVVQARSTNVSLGNLRAVVEVRQSAAPPRLIRLERRSATCIFPEVSSGAL